MGETRSKHSGVVSGFGQVVIKEGGLDPEMGRLLRDLFEARNVADYSMMPISSDEAANAIRAAERFDDAVERWTADRRR